MPPMISVHRLEKRYGALTALAGVSFEVGAGEIVGFLGPNGAGKSTTMKILTGFTAPTAGTARVAGFDVVGDSIEVRRRVGYLPESAPSYAEMRVLDYLDFIGRVRGLATAERTTAVERAASLTDITDRLHQVIGTLSKGYKQRVGLAQALLHEPPVLILDEPTSGLDPNQIVVIRDLIREIGRSRTVILSTHILQEVKATCDRVIIVNRGTIVADGSTERIHMREAGSSLIRATYGPGTVRLGAARIRELIEAVPGVLKVAVETALDEGQERFEVLAERDVRPDLFQLAVDQGLVLWELDRDQSSLEGVFRRLTVEAPPAGSGAAPAGPAGPAPTA